MVLWMVAVAVAVAVGRGGVCAQRTNDLQPVSHSHRVVLDQDGAFVMLWTPRDDAIVMELQVSRGGASFLPHEAVVAGPEGASGHTQHVPCK